MRFGVTALVCVLLLTERLASTSEPDLARARELFRQNRWPEAREAIASKMDSLSRADRDQARFLLGLSHVREAELYRALSVFSTDVGLAYMKELAQQGARALPWVPLFRGSSARRGDYEGRDLLWRKRLFPSLSPRVEEARDARRDLAGA
jgi:hypothetical protein